MGIGGSLDQLCGDTDLVTGLAHAALNYVTDIELCGHRPDV
jgi:hypothetical protein